MISRVNATEAVAELDACPNCGDPCLASNMRSTGGQRNRGRAILVPPDLVQIDLAAWYSVTVADITLSEAGEITEIEVQVRPDTRDLPVDNIFEVGDPDMPESSNYFTTRASAVLFVKHGESGCDDNGMRLPGPGEGSEYVLVGTYTLPTNVCTVRMKTRHENAFGCVLAVVIADDGYTELRAFDSGSVKSGDTLFGLAEDERALGIGTLLFTDEEEILQEAPNRQKHAVSDNHTVAAVYQTTPYVDFSQRRRENLLSALLGGMGAGEGLPRH